MLKKTFVSTLIISLSVVACSAIGFPQQVVPNFLSFANGWGAENPLESHVNAAGLAQASDSDQVTVPSETPLESSVPEIPANPPFETSWSSPTASPVPADNLDLVVTPLPSLMPPPSLTATPPPPPSELIPATPMATSTPEIVITEIPLDVNPLTGLRVSDLKNLERRPLGIKITIFPRQARPQWGLSMADLVFEYYLEHGLTRFLAFFYGQDASPVGPVRSARFFDEHLIRMYKAVFVFANADRKVLDHLLETDLLDYFVVERQDNCPPMCRDKFRAGYNNLFTGTRGLSEYIDERGVDNTRPDLRGLFFDPQQPEGGLPGLSVSTTYSEYSYNQWLYASENDQYQRMQDAVDNYGQGEKCVPLTDQLTGQPVNAANVVLLFVPHAYYSEEPEIVTMQLWGVGPAYVFRGGEVFKVLWERATQDSVITLAFPDGRPFPLKPGATFFQIVGQTTEVWQFGEAWRFAFQIP